MRSDRLFPAMLRAALLGGMLLFVCGALVDSTKPGVAVVAAAFGALSGAITVFLLSQFPVGPVGKLLLGLACGPFFPVLVVLLAAHGGDRPGDRVGAAWFAGLILGLFVGILEAYRASRRAREVADMP